MAASSRNRYFDARALPLEVVFPYEQLLAESLRGFLGELCLTSSEVILAYVDGEQAENIGDLVASSAELTLKPGLLRYGRGATIDSTFGCPPELSIDLELHHASLAAYFRVVFEAQAVGVRMDGILFRDALGAPEDNFRRFAVALAECRLANQ
ncbi:hypothetical protein [Aquabacter spiritensis]|uniref:Uncharacterized protein n=1 Tax=Aquabacter spiritensis TaxID=933073 RepID=A0A4R3M982_9HYPH|nr:hypothetical protein [Aquabacter spiritensis]TCT07935.1 hypothetical protein EDC64_101454 [Aquabacter spiritensis]